MNNKGAGDVPAPFLLNQPNSIDSASPDKWFESLVVHLDQAKFQTVFIFCGMILKYVGNLLGKTHIDAE